MRAKYIKPRKGAKIPKWRIQYFDDAGKYLSSEMGFKLKETTREHAETRMMVMARRDMLAEAGIPQQSTRAALDLVQEYIDTTAPKGGVGGRPWNADYLRQNQVYLPWWIEKLGISKPAQATLPAVEKILNGLTRANGSALSNGTKNMRFKFLNSWLIYCRTRGYIHSNPVQGFTYYDPQTRDPRRALTLLEFGQLFKVLPYGYRLAYPMALLTGIRSTALSRLAPDDIDWTAKVVRVGSANQKNNKAQEYPLPDWYLEGLRTYLKTIPAAGAVFPFLSPDHEARRLRVHLKAAGIPFRTKAGKVDFHALRVTFGTWVNEGGADPKTLQSLLGHATPIISLQVYVTANQDRRRAAVDGIGSQMLLAGGTHGVQPVGEVAGSPGSIGYPDSGLNPFRKSPTAESSADTLRTSTDISEIRSFLAQFLAVTQPRTPAGQERTPERYPIGTTLPESLAFLHQLHPDDLAEVLALARALAAYRKGRAQA